MTVLGVTRGLRTPAAQGLYVTELEAEATEVQLHVLCERAVTDRENESVAANPTRIAGVVAHDLLVQQVRCGSQANGGAGVAIANLFYRVCCEHSRGVYRTIIKLIPLQYFAHESDLSQIFMARRSPAEHHR
jgi:hypothetical protein